MSWRPTQLKIIFQLLAKWCFSSYRKRVNEKQLALWYILSHFAYLISNMRKRNNSSIQAPCPQRVHKTPRHFHNLLGQFYYALLYNSIFVCKKTIKKSTTLEPKHSTLQTYKVWWTCHSLLFHMRSHALLQANILSK